MVGFKMGFQLRGGDKKATGASRGTAIHGFFLTTVLLKFHLNYRRL